MKKRRSNDTGFIFRTKTEAVAFARKVDGKNRYSDGAAMYECPSPAVMTTKIGKTKPELQVLGYRYWVAIGCRLRK